MMTWLRSFFRFFSSRTFWVFMGVVALSLFIWFAGPLFAFADYRPLAGAAARSRIIITLFVLFVLWLLVGFWRRRRISAALFERIGKIKESAQSQRGDSEVCEEVKELQEDFSQALRTLRTMRVDGKSGHSLWGSKFIYELPWYIVVGAPGAGKTTALVNSGLNFPLEGQFGRAALQGVGGTRNCDWWFTDQAVLIDTAGRYTTQDSDPNIDKSEWQGFLALLKKYRPRQPVNGVMLTLSVADLLTMSDDELAAHLCALRERLVELQAAFSIEIPVYLLVTKVDWLAGFSEFFGAFSKVQRDQVLGFTFKYSEQASSNCPSLAAFDEQWTLLEQSLFSVQDEHLAREIDQEARNYIYAFPQQFAALRPRIAQAVEFVFAESRLLKQPMLRGVYFGSGTQDGTALDRVFVSLNGQAAAPVSNESSGRSENAKSYFLHDLLGKVIFGEANLAGRNIRWEKRTRMLGYLGYGLSVALLAAATSAWFISWGNNKDYLAHIGGRTEEVSTAVKSYNSDTGDLTSLLALLDGVKGLGDMPDFTLEEAPLGYRHGLYQGKKVEAARDNAYGRMLDNGLKPLVSRRMEEQLRHPPVHDLEYLYESLKAYLMLQHPEHYSADFLKQWVGADIKRFVLPDADPDTLHRVDTHLEALFSKRHVVTSTYPMDDKLVDEARQKLATLSTAQRAYYRLRGRLMRNDLSEFNIMDVAGPQAANVFQRPSGQPLNRGVPGLFTFQGYWTLFDKSVNGVVSEVGDAEGWVLGIPGKQLDAQLGDAIKGKLVREVRMLFLREYQQHWIEYLQDIELIPSESLTGSIQRLSVLSAPDSPLPLLLRGIVRETTLLRESVGNDQTVVEKMTNKLKNTRDDIERVIGTVDIAHSARESKDERIVDDYFEPLRRLVGVPGKPVQSGLPIDSLMKALDEYYSTLMAADAAVRAGITPPPADAAIRLRAEAARLPVPLNKMLTTISSASSKHTSSLMRSQLGSSLNASVGDFCRKAIEGRYPLNKSSGSDVLPQDFARLFGANGIMEDFFNKNLTHLVDAGTWSFKKNIDGSKTGGDGSLLPFQRASVIRNVFFASGGPLPKLHLDIKIIEMDPGLVSMALDVDGTVLRYSHGPQVSQSVVWPGPRGRQEVSLQAFDKAGGQSAIKTDGAWALHRFFDKLSITAGRKSENFTATATINGRKVVLEVTTSSVQNPFRLPQLHSFRCPSAF